VRIKGLEPPRLSALDPKSSAATNYAISAKLVCKCSEYFYNIANFSDKYFNSFKFNYMDSYQKGFVKIIDQLRNIPDTGKFFYPIAR
jgi:hypothetical protein